MVICNVAVCVTPPPEASIVTDVVPSSAAAPAENETVVVQVGAQELLLKLAVTPVGNPVAEKMTGLVVPLAKVAVKDEERLIEP